MPTDAPFTWFVAAQMAAHRNDRPIDDPMHALKVLGRSWLGLRDAIVSSAPTGGTFPFGLLVDLAAECQRAAEDLGLCPRAQEGPQEARGATLANPDVP